MNFLLPTAFILTTLIPIIIAFYFLKLRREEQQVSSVYLWRRAVRDVEANAPWQRLRRNLLLFLQIAFLVALILALARPFHWVEGAAGQNVILILDTSASMAATDVTPSRLETAKDRALELIEGLPDGARVTVIAASDEARVLISAAQDRSELRAAIQSAVVQNAGSDLTAALTLAAAIAARQPDTEIVILSDGAVALPHTTLPARVRFVPVGVRDNNQAIGALSLREEAGGQALSAFVQVINYGRETAHRRLDLLADGAAVNAYELELKPGAVKAIVVEDLPATTQMIEARLAGPDALATDDHAWAIHHQNQTSNVTLVSPGNLFLETALSLLPGLQLTTVKPETYEEAIQPSNIQTSSLQSPTPSLTILDRYVPLTATLPAGNLLFIAPMRSTEFFTVTGTIAEPQPHPVSTDETLLRHVNLADVGVLEAVHIPLPNWARLVMRGEVQVESETDSAPLLFVGEVDGRRVAVLTFDLLKSDLPLQVAFPLLLANLMDYLAPGVSGNLPEQLAPGEPLALSVPPGVDEIFVERPDGTRARLEPEGGQAIYGDTRALGVYRVSWESEEDAARQALVAVNLFNPGESAIAPQEEMPLLSEEAGVVGPTAAERARREWWRPLAASALALLVVEWLVYHRVTVTRVIWWLTGSR
ncbi:MAG: BatA and WFA domain-containing protein [Chloroflexota bacterium]|nr:BatA and WFA domain-containing protein [Chloroflexota bacterium]